MAKQFYHKVSKLFQPINNVPFGAEVKNNDLLSRSYKLMVDQGIIAPSQHGFFYFLPLANRALEKLTKLVDQHMASVGAQKMSCPILTNSEIWEKTGRLDLAGPELILVKDRHAKQFILSPTHEESVTQLLASVPALSYKNLPILLYQITPKFRDEPRPRFGLIRTREFLMKDLYSFDISVEAAELNYKMVSQTYDEIFNALGVNFLKVKGFSGMMGGDISHEFHFLAAVGDDTLCLCEKCANSWNRETGNGDTCQHCGNKDIRETKGIEVGHTFMLGTRYSAPLHALFTGSDGGRHPLVMGSYGLGLSRILAASLEVLSLPDQLRWPPLLVPYSTIIITPKEGSKENKTTEHLADEIYCRLQEVHGFENEVIIDDRSHLSIGKRLKDACRTGYQYVVVVGKKAVAPAPMIELHNVNTSETSLHSVTDLISLLADRNQQQSRISVTQ